LCLPLPKLPFGVEGRAIFGALLNRRFPTVSGEFCHGGFYEELEVGDAGAEALAVALENNTTLRFLCGECCIVCLWTAVDGVLFVLDFCLSLKLNLLVSVQN